MSMNYRKICLRCKKPGVEVIDDWESLYCGHCADILADHDRERREWDYYHPPLNDEEKK